MAYSFVRYTANGSTTNYTFPFPYLSQDHVKVRLNNVLTTNFSFLNANTVQLFSAPAAGVVVEIRRETPKDNAVVNFTDGSVLLERDLDLLAQFDLFLAQETEDSLDTSLRENATGNWDAESKRITNVANPVDDQDAAPKKWTEDRIIPYYGATAPDPNQYKRWISSVDAREYLWINDGDSSQWVEMAGPTTYATKAGSAEDFTYTPAGTGAVATTVQAKLRETVSVSGYATFQQALNAAAGKVLFLDSDVVLSTNDLIDFSAASNTVITGPGKIIGPAVAVSGQPTAYLKLWGSIGSGVAYGSTIAEAASNFTLSQSFAANDLLLLSNFPTDATDAYTEGGADIFGDKARFYATTNTSNLRQTRRKELAVVRSATGSSFTLMNGVVNPYPSTASLQFQKITPLSNVKFIGVTFENVHINLRYARNVEFVGCVGASTMLVGAMCHGVKVDFQDFDSRNTDCRVDFYEASRSLHVTGSYRNINTPADNAIIKFLGCVDFHADVVIEGCKGSAGNGVMVDTAFVESPTGYSDLPAMNFSIRAVARGCDGQGVVVTCDPWAAKASYGQVFMSSDDTGIQVKGAENVDVYGNINFADGSNNSVYLYGAVNTNIFGRIKGNIYNTTISNPRNGANTQSTSGTSRSGALITASNQPGFVAYLTSASANATGDGTEVAIAFNSELVDKNNNQFSGTFTAPQTGLYRFDTTIKLNSVGAGHTSGWVRILADGTSYYYQPSFAAIASASGDCALTFSTCAYMTAGSIAQTYVKVNGSTKTVGIQGSSSLETFWSGTLLN